MFLDFVNGFHQYVNQLDSVNPFVITNILDVVMTASDTFLKNLSVSVRLGHRCPQDFFQG